MPAWVISLVSVMVGGVIAMLGNVVQDSLKHSREKKSTASALAASIQGSLDMVERRQYIQFFEHNLAALRQGVPLQFGRIVAYENLIDPIAERYLDRLGLFDADLALKIAGFYSNLMGIRLDLQRLHAGELKGVEVQIIEEDLRLWKQTDTDGREAVARLRKVAGS